MGHPAAAAQSDSDQRAAGGARLIRYASLQSDFVPSFNLIRLLFSSQPSPGTPPGQAGGRVTTVGTEKGARWAGGLT